jgi:hypothetical protein
VRDPADAAFAAEWFKVDAELSERMGAAFVTEGPWRERIRTSCATALAYFAEDPARARLYVVDSLFAGKNVLDARQEAIERLGAMIDAGKAETTKLPGRPWIVAVAVAGGVWNRVQALIREERAAELPGELPQLMYFIVLPYLGTEIAFEELERPFPGSL